MQSTVSVNSISESQAEVELGADINDLACIAELDINLLNSLRRLGAAPERICHALQIDPERLEMVTMIATRFRQHL